MGEDQWVVRSENAGMRLDGFLQEQQSEWSRSHIQKLIREGFILVNGHQVKTGEKLKENDMITMTTPPTTLDRAEPENIPLDVIYEDEDLIVVNKARGMVVHPAPGHFQGTLVNALLWHCQDLQGINNTLRPGIVHRLDKDTTGLLVVAKNEATMKDLMRQMKERTIQRYYYLLVHGMIQETTGMIDAPVGRHRVHRKQMAVEELGREAVTRFTVLERFTGFTFVEARLETGRTHQIRVHFSYIGFPVVGDPLYGPRRQAFSLTGQALHAGYLSFVHPRTGERVEFKAPLPTDVEEVLAELRKLNISGPLTKR